MIQAGDVAATQNGVQWAGDFVGVAFHGNSVSHIDALSHVFVDGRMYNGAPATDVTRVGARRSSIEVADDGIVGRGVLLDVPRLRGVVWLEPGDAITPDELDATGVTVEQGDIVLVHTGRDRRRDALGPWNTYLEGLAGLEPECARWLHDKDPSVLGGDGVSDVMPGPDPEWPIPIHMCALVGMGIHLLDNLRLDLLADTCAERGRWEFLFVVAPPANRWRDRVAREPDRHHLGLLRRTVPAGCGPFDSTWGWPPRWPCSAVSAWRAGRTRPRRRGVPKIEIGAARTGLTEVAREILS
jgi:kynurenine formamidase